MPRVSAVVADTSVWIEFFAGRAAPSLEQALRHGLVVLPPLVVAELVSGVRPGKELRALDLLLRELPVHPTPLEHWLAVGGLRRRLLERGLTVSTPDAHVAQCALELEALLLTRDRVFGRIARHSELRYDTG
jgi:hypothetical protein